MSRSRRAGTSSRTRRSSRGCARSSSRSFSFVVFPGVARAAPSISVYCGLGTWVSIFGTDAYSSPDTVAASIAARGVKTVYMQTGNYSQTDDVVSPFQLGLFVDALHMRGVHVVAWYLPGFRTPAVDLRRALAAIRFETPSGGRFDGFALDIESWRSSPATAHSRVLTLSRPLRAAVGSGFRSGRSCRRRAGCRGADVLAGLPVLAARGHLRRLPADGLLDVQRQGSRRHYGYLAWSLAILLRRDRNPDSRSTSSAAPPTTRRSRRSSGVRAARDRRRPPHGVEPVRLVRDEAGRLADPRGNLGAGGATLCYMERVGVRELRQNLSVYLRRVGAGQTLEVTERGRPVARSHAPRSAHERVRPSRRGGEIDAGHGARRRPAAAGQVAARRVVDLGGAGRAARRAALSPRALHRFVRAGQARRRGGRERCARRFVNGRAASSSRVSSRPSRCGVRLVARVPPRPAIGRSDSRSRRAGERDPRSSGAVERTSVRSLDAIQLATALALGDALESLVAYDRRPGRGRSRKRRRRRFSALAPVEDKPPLLGRLGRSRCGGDRVGGGEQRLARSSRAGRGDTRRRCPCARSRRGSGGRRPRRRRAARRSVEDADHLSRLGHPGRGSPRSVRRRR